LVSWGTFVFGSPRRRSNFGWISNFGAIRVFAPKLEIAPKL
jgi:hypothetical protein